MRRWWVIALLLLPVLLRAEVTRGLTFELSGAVGASTLGYKTGDETDGLNQSRKMGLGANGHLGAELFFTRYVGLGIGVDLTRYCSRHSLDGTLLWNGVTDTDGERYNHTTQIRSLKEAHQRLTVAPQVLLVGQIPMGPLKLHWGAGLEYTLPLTSSFKTTGTLTHTGFYPATNLTLHDVPNHGFYTDGEYQQSGSLDKGQKFLALVGRLDLLIPLSERWNLGVGVIYKRCLSGSEEAGGDQLFGIRESQDEVSEEVYEAHRFMSDYAALSTTGMTAGKYLQQLFAFNLALRYTIPFQSHRHYRCMCDDY